ncbi:MAG: lipocalin-like domain-containing protein [Anaerolineae bacterium]|nr:carotenoid 1,2-hydratase [Candidatus Roseilinea sp.]MDW8450355.1 lipocalin-like domain-containing protein [Anaerolineae bacterium]
MNRGLQIGVSVAAVVGLTALGWAAFRPSEDSGEQARATVAGLQRDEMSDRFARAMEPRAFEFPRDHGPHDEYQTEWWYYTGNLFDASGRHFGYQLTFFRRALVPPDEQAMLADRASAFAFDQVYFAHFAVTDSAANEHVSFEKYSRGAGGLAGAQASPFRVFVEDWSATAARDDGDAAQVRLVAAQDGYAIDLTLANTKPFVFHGDRGLSQKSPNPGNASYYYSMTRMATQGKVTTPRGTFEVAGNSWLDREWSTSALDDDTEGWDWFSLQFDDRREIMFFKLRQKETGGITFAKGTYVDADGRTELIRQDEVMITVLDRWTSPQTGAPYPVRWRLASPRYGLDIEIVARIPDQEMRLTQRYWEGAVTFTGISADGPVAGVGYVEMTGY